MARAPLHYTDSAIRKATYQGDGKHDTEYRILGHPGLLLIVHPASIDEKHVKSWRVQYSKVEGDGDARKQVKYRVSLGAYPTKSLAMAAAEAAALMVSVKQEKRNPVAEQRQQAAQDALNALTFADLVREYVADRRARGASSIGELERALLKDPALSSFLDLRPKDITERDVQQAVDAVCERMAKELVERMKRMKQPVTKEDESRRDFEMARHVRRYIAQAFNFGLLDDVVVRERYRLTTNPAASVGRNRRGAVGRYGKPRARSRHLDDKGIATFLIALDGSQTSTPIKTMLKVALYTCSRSDEVRSAMINELKLDGAQPVWTLPGARTKNGKARIIPLSPPVVALLRRAVGDRKGGLVFLGGGKDGLVNAKGMRQAMARLKASGRIAEHVSPHDLRRTVETGLTRLGVVKEVREQVLGHTPQDVGSKHYNVHNWLPEKRAALTLWADHVEKLIQSNSIARAG